MDAFWGADDAYYLRIGGQTNGVWYRFEAEAPADNASLAAAMKAAAWLADITPLHVGRVAFPVGSTGRRFYRVGRSGVLGAGGRTTIREVRAARSRRLPA